MRMKLSRQPTLVILALLMAPGLIPSMPAAQIITLQVTAEQANIREKPDLMSPVVKQVIAGAVLEAEKKEGEWYEVKVDLDTGGTIIGYVHESLVRVVAGGPAKAGPPPGEVKAPPAAPKEGTKPPQQQPEPSTKTPESGAPQKKPPVRRSVSIWFGGRYAVVGDLNDGAAGMADYFASRLDADKSSDVSSVHVGTAFGAEYRHSLTGGVDVAIGAGYFSADQTSTINFKDQPTTTRYMTTPAVSAIPVSLSLLFHLTPRLYVKAGAEFAFAHGEYLYRFEEGGEVQEWQGSADAVGIGLALAAGYELRLSGTVSVFAEAGYRKLQLDSLDGEEIYRESGKTDVTTKGTLYFSRSALPDGSTFTGVFIHPDFPGGTGVVEARKAELSLSGTSLHVGLRINF
jgi:Bacterial SH3 domain